MQTLPREITEPLFFALQNYGDFVLCPAKLWSSADFAPRNCGDIVSGANLNFFTFFLIIFVNHCFFRDLYNPLDHFLRIFFCVTVPLSNYKNKNPAKKNRD